MTDFECGMLSAAEAMCALCRGDGDYETAPRMFMQELMHFHKNRKLSLVQRCSAAAIRELLPKEEASTMHNIPTVILPRTGAIVLAHRYKGELTAIGYGNRTQAQKRATELGPGWFVFRGLGRPFYVRRVDS